MCRRTALDLLEVVAQSTRLGARDVLCFLLTAQQELAEGAGTNTNSNVVAYFRMNVSVYKVGSRYVQPRGVIVDERLGTPQ